MTQIKRQLYAAIASTIAEYIQDEQFRTWAMESVPSIWGDKIHELNFAGNNTVDYMYRVALDDVPVSAWSGLIPQQVVAAISSLIAISPDVSSRPKQKRLPGCQAHRSKN